MLIPSFLDRFTFSTKLNKQSTFLLWSSIENVELFYYSKVKAKVQTEIEKNSRNVVQDLDAYGDQRVFIL